MDVSRPIVSFALHAATSILVVCAAAAEFADTRNIITGHEIPSEGYCDQPYIVITDDGHWLCTMTTGPGHEGDERQHVVASISEDQGRTWTPLIDIEPHGPPEASWVMPLKANGRVYAFYVYNGDNLREVIASTDYARRRVDTLGHFMFRYSDDGGRTWSPERYRVPIRTFEIDRANPYGGEVHFFWGVGKPMVHDGVAYMGLAKVGSFGDTFIERSEGFFLRSDNILTERDPDRIRWETLPKGEIGLRAPEGPIAEEHNLVALSNGDLYCTWRTVAGYPCHAYSRDGGRTWTPIAPMTEQPGGRMIKNPRAANFVRKFSNGKFLYWSHNHGGKTFADRNPAWLRGGIEIDGHIHWSQPEIVLYDDDPSVRMSYPDFIEDGGRIFVTETQKSVARVHEIETTLLDALWNQHDRAKIADEALALSLKGVECGPETSVTLNEAYVGQGLPGFSLDAWVTVNDAEPPHEIVRVVNSAGHGFVLSVNDRRGFTWSWWAEDGPTHWDSDDGVITAGQPQHIAIIHDADPRILMFVVDGILCDGASEREQGWYRIPAASAQWPAGHTLASAGGSTDITSIRMYARAMRVSDAVSNFRAG